MVQTAGDTLRILLISGQEGLRDEVGRALERRTGDYRLYWVAQPGLALSRAEELVPDVILLDDDLMGVSAASVIRDLCTRVPGAVILALEDPDAVAKASEAVLAGARGFVTKPLDADDLATVLRQVLQQKRPLDTEPEQASPTEHGRVVVFCAPKGGTGRTTLTVNTAIGLRMIARQPVALVDADYAAPAIDVALNLPNQRSILNLLPRLSRLDEELVLGVLAKHASGIRVLLAPPPPDLPSPISLPQVQQILMLLRRMFAWVLVDLGLPLDETAFAFLDGADRIVVSVLPEMVALRNTRLMLDQLYGWGYPQSKVWLVVNRATMKGGISTRDIEHRLGIRISHRIADDQALAMHSINRGVPVLMSHRRGALGRSFRGFVRLLMDDLSPMSQRAGGERARSTGDQGKTSQELAGEEKLPTRVSAWVSARIG
ncbi:MAG TPA: response regulator [Anaerolineae bacterium]|nr:response regulator [Anaerolineae bacterium]